MTSDTQSQGSGNQILIWTAVAIVVLAVIYLVL
jgi:hypothetical protein